MAKAPHLRLAAVLTSGLLLVACQPSTIAGSVSVEKESGYIFLRSDGRYEAPDMYYRATVSVGAGNCLYVELGDQKPALLILDDETEVTSQGLRTPDGFEVAFGEEVNVLRTNADNRGTHLDGLEACDDTGRTGIAFVGDPR
jgi:hypothetical protein